jgi:hypothetical protein
VQRTVCANWGFFMKELWRNRYITPRDDCSVSSLDDKGIQCGYTCTSQAANDLPSVLKDMLSSYVDESAAGDDDTWTIMRDFVCYGDAYKVFVGDHLESASTADPSFWPTHPTLERLVQLKYMTGITAGFTWPTSAPEVCDLAFCYEDDVKAYHSQCCYGHYEGDQLLDFVNRDATQYIGPTNGETMAATDPTSSTYSMPYIYNHFKWDHCEEDFPGAIESAFAAGPSFSSGPSSAAAAHGGSVPSVPVMKTNMRSSASSATTSTTASTQVASTTATSTTATSTVSTAASTTSTRTPVASTATATATTPVSTIVASTASTGVATTGATTGTSTTSTTTASASTTDGGVSAVLTPTTVATVSTVTVGTVTGAIPTAAPTTKPGGNGKGGVTEVKLVANDAQDYARVAALPPRPGS